MSLYSQKVIADGASAYWRLDELSGNFIDEIAGLVGTPAGGITRGTPGALADGNVAATFNGSTGQVTLPVSAPLAAWVTFECWFKTSSGVQPGNYGIIDDAWAGFTNGRLIRINGTTGIIAVLSWSGGALSFKNGTRTGLWDLEWHHLVVVHSAGLVTVYIDGVIDINAQVLTAQGASGVACVISDVNGSQPFAGSLDEVALYPAVLTAAQILLHYNLRHGAYASKVISDGPSAYWRLDELTGNFIDEIGSVAMVPAGSVTRGSQGALVDGNVSADFLGTDGQAVANAAALAGSILGATSIEAWIWADTLSATVRRIIFSGKSTSYFSLNTATGRLFFSLDIGAAQQFITGATNVTVGGWHHVVGTWDGDKLRVYLDGVLDATSASFVGATSWGTGAFKIGTSNAASVPEDFFDGRIDEVALYAVALTPAQIAEHYALRTWGSYSDKVANDGAISYWRLGERSGTIAVDSIGTYDGAYVNTPTLGEIGVSSDGDTAVDFLNSSSERVDIGVIAAFSPSTPYSIEVWVKPLRTFVNSTNYAIFGNEVFNASGLLMRLESNHASTPTGGLINFRTSQAAASTGMSSPYSPALIPGAGWAHIIFTYDGTNGRIYLNGSLVAGPTAMAYPVVATAITAISPGSQYFNGLLDEVAFYNRTLSQAEIASHYSFGQAFSGFGGTADIGVVMLANPGFRRGAAVVTSDTVNIDGTTDSANLSPKPKTCDALYIGTAGVVAVVFANKTAVNFTCYSGQLLLVQAIRVNATNTTGAAIVALYQA